MRQIPKVKGSKFNVFEKEFKAIGSPRTKLATFLGVSKPYIDKWLVQKFIPLEHFKEVLLFISLNKVARYLNAYKSFSKTKTGLYSVSLKGAKLLFQVLEGREPLLSDADVAIEVKDRAIKVRKIEHSTSLEKSILLEKISSLLIENGIENSKIYSDYNSIRYITDDESDLDSLQIPTGDGSYFELNLSKHVEDPY